MTFTYDLMIKNVPRGTIAMARFQTFLYNCSTWNNREITENKQCVPML